MVRITSGRSNVKGQIIKIVCKTCLWISIHKSLHEIKMILCPSELHHHYMEIQILSGPAAQLPSAERAGGRRLGVDLHELPYLSQ